MTIPQSMSETSEKLKLELSQLSPKERAEIAYFLIHSLDEDIDVDTLCRRTAEILGSTSPLKLDPLRYLKKRWFSPQALTDRIPTVVALLRQCVAGFQYCANCRAKFV
ncbi:hypothetical protein NIES22_22610 [Calothrix brevissima NIES-22]|nr:hypothetical protein NIES22_22610 [Calothrix brevissima NIES-22]